MQLSFCFYVENSWPVEARQPFQKGLNNFSAMVHCNASHIQLLLSSNAWKRFLGNHAMHIIQLIETHLRPMYLGLVGFKLLGVFLGLLDHSHQFFIYLRGQTHISQSIRNSRFVQGGSWQNVSVEVVMEKMVLGHK